MSVQPVTPANVAQAKLGATPDFVIEAFNLLIALNYNNSRATFKQDEVIAKIIELAPVDMMSDVEDRPGALRGFVFKKGWLNVEAFYRKAGWKVEYDKPGYNENYDANFTFSPKRPKSEEED